MKLSEIKTELTKKGLRTEAADIGRVEAAIKVTAVNVDDLLRKIVKQLMRLDGKFPKAEQLALKGILKFTSEEQVRELLRRLDMVEDMGASTKEEIDAFRKILSEKLNSFKTTSSDNQDALDFDTLEDARVWYSNSGFSDWDMFDGFDEDDFIEYLYRNSDGNTIGDDLMRTYLEDKGEDPEKYSL